jgi:hypothetical protein
MTAGHGHGQDRRNLAAAYLSVANALNQAAQIYEEVAELYGRHDEPDSATGDGQIAAEEQQNAVTDQTQAEPAGQATGGDAGNSSEKQDRPGLHGADLAALLGATITVLLTLTYNPGAWGPLSTIIGLFLMVALLTFFWRRRPPADKWPWPDRLNKCKSLFKPEKWIKFVKPKAWKKLFGWKKWEPFFVGFAVSVVMGFAVAIASAQAIQWKLFPDDNPSECRSIAVAQATMAARDLSETDVKDFSHIDLSKTNLYFSNREESFLQVLIDSTLKYGHRPVADKPEYAVSALEYAFYRQYDRRLATASLERPSTASGGWE